MRRITALSVALVAAACSPPAAAPSAPGSSTPSAPVVATATAPSVPVASDMPSSPASSGPAGSGAQALLPDPDAANTLGDTIRVSGGEFVGDQAELVVLEAVRRAERQFDGTPEYAFLVEITGRDAENLPFNALDFAIIDDQNFRYDSLNGRQKPELTFGDLPPGRKVKGWLTFPGPESSAFLELEYSPTLAMEPTYVRVRLP